MDQIIKIWGKVKESGNKILATVADLIKIWTGKPEIDDKRKDE